MPGKVFPSRKVCVLALLMFTLIFCSVNFRQRFSHLRYIQYSQLNIRYANKLGAYTEKDISTCSFPIPAPNPLLHTYKDSDPRYFKCRNPVLAFLNKHKELEFYNDTCTKENRYYTINETPSYKKHWKRYTGRPVDLADASWASAICTHPNGIQGVPNSINLSTVHDVYKLEEPNIPRILKRRKTENVGLLEGMNVVLIQLDSVSTREFSRSMTGTQELLSYYSSHKLREATLFEFHRFHSVGDHSQDNLEVFFTGHDISGFHRHFAKKFKSEVADCDDLFHRDFILNGYLTAYFTQFCDFAGPPEIAANYIDRFCRDKSIVGEASPVADILNPTHYSCDHIDFTAPLNTCKCRKFKTLADFAKQTLEISDDADIPIFLNINALDKHYSIEMQHLRSADADMVDLLKHINLSTSMVFIVGDHGMHFGPHLESDEGMFEHYSPVFKMLLPTSWLEKHSNIESNLLKNEWRLITHWDIHATFKHLFSYPLPPLVKGSLLAKSIFSSISPTRSCLDAGIREHICQCNRWQHIKNTRKFDAVGSIGARLVSNTRRSNKKLCPDPEFRFVSSAWSLVKKNKGGRWYKIHYVVHSPRCSDQNINFAVPLDNVEPFTISYGGNQYKVSCNKIKDFDTTDLHCKKLEFRMNCPLTCVKLSSDYGTDKLNCMKLTNHPFKSKLCGIKSVQDHCLRTCNMCSPTVSSRSATFELIFYTPPNKEHTQIKDLKNFCNDEKPLSMAQDPCILSHVRISRMNKFENSLKVEKTFIQRHQKSFCVSLDRTLIEEGDDPNEVDGFGCMERL